MNVLLKVIFIYVLTFSSVGWCGRHSRRSVDWSIERETKSRSSLGINGGNRKQIEAYNARLEEHENRTLGAMLTSPTVLFFSAMTVVALFLLRLQRKRKPGDSLSLELSLVRMERERLQKYTDELNQQVLETSCQETLGDDHFNSQQLQANFENLFTQLMEAFSSGRVERLRPYMTEGLYQQFYSSCKIYDSAGLHYSLSNIEMYSSVLCDLKSDGVFDKISIYFNISAVEQFLNLSEIASYGSKKPKKKKIEWTFVRKKGVKSLAQGLLSNFCPSCQEKVSKNSDGCCESCGVDFRQGDYDWILSESITHLPHCSPHLLKSEEVALSELQLKDPNFSTVNLFDKLTHIFWSLRYSEFEHDFRFVRQFITPKLLKTISGNRSDYKWTTTVDAMLVKFDVIEFQPASDDEFDRLLVKVIWYGREIIRESGEAVQPNLADLQLVRQTYTLKRNKKCTTLNHQYLHSGHCPKCDKPLSSKNDKSCESCHASLVDGYADWVVEDIAKFKRKYKVPIVPDYREKVPYYSERFTIGENKLIAVIETMLLDDVEACELEMLAIIARKLDVSSERLAELIDVVKREAPEVSEPISIKDSEELLILVITMAFSNGDLSMSERELIHSFARKLGFRTEADIMRLFRKAKLELKEQMTERGQYE